MSKKILLSIVIKAPARTEIYNAVLAIDKIDLAVKVGAVRHRLDFDEFHYLLANRGFNVKASSSCLILNGCASSCRMKHSVVP